METGTPKQLAVVGSGMACARLLRALAQRGYKGRATVIGDEPVPFYNRVLLPDYLAGRHGLDVMRDPALARPQPFELAVRSNQSVRAIDLAMRQLSLSDGTTLAYDDLVLAMGSRAPRPAVPGICCAGVTALRKLQDADSLRAPQDSTRQTVVIGGGLLGLETAYALNALGDSVTVVHRNTTLLNRQLDQGTAMLLQTALETRGLRFQLGTQLARVDGKKQCEAIRLDNGERLPCDRLVLATGTTARDELAKTAGVSCDDGVLVDDQLRTDQPHVYAIGECARVRQNTSDRGIRYGLVAPVNAQADVLAAVLCGQPDRFAAAIGGTRLKVADVALYSAGDVSVFDHIGEDAATQVLEIRDEANGIVRSLAFQHGQLTAARLLGDSRGSRAIEVAMASGPCSLKTQEALLYGRPHAA